MGGSRPLPRSAGGPCTQRMQAAQTKLSGVEGGLDARGGEEWWNCECPGPKQQGPSRVPLVAGERGAEGCPPSGAQEKVEAAAPEGVGAEGWVGKNENVVSDSLA